MDKRIQDIPASVGDFDEVPTPAALSDAVKEYNAALEEIAVIENEEEVSAGNALTPRRMAFAREYVRDQNGKAAAIRAGYSKASAHSTASVLLTVPKVRAMIDKLQADRAAAVGVTQESILAEMHGIAIARHEHFTIDDHGNIVLAPGAPADALAAIKSQKKKIRKHLERGEVVAIDYEVTFELWDKPGSLKTLGRHVGLFPDKVELTGKDGGPVLLEAVRSVIVDPKESVSEQAKPVVTTVALPEPSE